MFRPRFRPSALRLPAAAGLILALAAASNAAAPVYRGEPSGKPMREWLLLGPLPAGLAPNAPDGEHLEGFETDHLAASGGEAAAAPKEGGEVRWNGGSAVWRRHVSEKDSVDLDAAVSTQERAAAYAYAEIESPGPAPAVLLFGTNDGGRLWLNGEQVWDEPRGRGLKPDADAVPAILKAGTNRLLLKIEERGLRWGFTFRIAAPGEVLDRDLGFFQVRTPAGGGSPSIVLARPAATAAAFLRSARFQIFDRAAGGPALWSGSWNGEAEIALGLPANPYRACSLKASLAFAGGESRELTIPFSAGRRVQYALFENGASPYRIVLAKEASESEHWAAEELRRWIAECGGPELPIADESVPARPEEIVLGWSSRAAEVLGPEAAAPAEDDESFTYRNIGPKIVILGGRRRGTMHGALAFLENELGVRWYSPSVTVAPKRAVWRFDSMNRTEKPRVRVRNDFYFEAFDPIWAARNRQNGAMNLRQQPGGVESYWGVHTFYPLVPPAEFFEAHPEWYSLVNGKRTHDRAQLCLTNPEVLEVLTTRLLEAIRKNPDYLIYDVSQNDWHGACECDSCLAVVEREGAESGVLLEFVNRVAERVEKEFPDKLVGTLAYQYTRKPPKLVRPRSNVVIRFCSIECCFAHPFGDCPKNADFLSDLRGWAAVAPRMYVWDYVVNFSHYVMPYPNFRALAPNIRAFADNHAIGIMEQAAYQSRGGEFAELRSWVVAKLLWNPDLNVDALVDDFLHGYYGRAGRSLRRYFDLLHGRLTPETHIGLGTTPDDPLYADPFMDQAGAIFDAAERMADNDAILRRVELARLPLLYLRCKRAPEEAVRSGDYARLRMIADREGVAHFAESGAPSREAFFAEMEAVAKRIP